MSESNEPQSRATRAAGLLGQGLVPVLDALRSGDVTAVELHDAARDRIAAVDPGINAVAEVLGHARRRAELADQRRASGAARPLEGVPIALKDDLNVAGHRTGYGSRALGDLASANTEIVERAEAAGAVLLCKTRVPEFDLWPLTESSAGGVTRNPWDPTLTPGGSSGGSAAAVAAGFVPAAIGSDGGGSVRIPAACCGVVGYKPSRGRFPTAPAAEIWRGLATYGTLTRSVLDAAVLADVLAGAASGDRFQLEGPASTFEEAASSPPVPANVRVAWNLRPATYGWRADPTVIAAVEEVARTLEFIGCGVQRSTQRWPDPTSVLSLCAAQGLVVASSYAGDHEVERATRTARRLGRLAQRTPDPWVRKRIDAIGSEANQIFEHVDFVLTPTIGSTPPTAGTVAGARLGPAIWRSRWAIPFAALWNLAGNPAISLPVGTTTDGVPLAVQIVGPRAADTELLAFARLVERAVGWDERPPLSRG